jgi:hypothetical protein
MTTTSEETRDFLLAGTIKDIAALIEACDFPENAYFLAELLPQRVISQEQRQDLLRFARVSDLKRRNAPADADKAKIDPALYTSGRIFCENFELRWSKNQRTGETQVVYLGEEARTFPGLEPARDLDRLRTDIQGLEKKPGSRSYYLFGTTLETSLGGERLQQMGLSQEDGWRYYAEVRIPRLLRYPRVNAPRNVRRVQLVVCEYVDKETGSVKLFRFQDLRAAQEERS